ncbi:MAG: ABC transporter ATP-binding protein [Tissierellia bacterium]|nr:ABC transporter ATP-binding protein [Tissierellia bacterium]
MIIKVDEIFFKYTNENILDGISFEVERPEVIGVLGSNGAGKSTLFGLLLKLLKAQSGDIFINGKNTKNLNSKELAKDLAYIPQSHFPTYNYSVLNTVLMGMASRIGVFSSPKKKEIKKAREILGDLNILHLEDRGYKTISGGERQLALIARAIIQDANILIMDEPTANLDFGNQSLVMNKVVDISKKGYTILISMHNPLHAYLYTDKVLIIHDRKIEAYGKTEEVLNEDILKKIYGIEVEILKAKSRKREYQIPIPKDINL